MLQNLSWFQDYCDEAYCMTFAQGLDTTELLRQFGGNISATRFVRFDDWEAQEELRPFGDVILVGQRDGWTFAYEENGYLGTTPDIMCPISAGTAAVSVYRSVNADTFFCYAENGVIVAGFDTLAPPFEDASPRILTLLHQAGISESSTENDDYDFVGAMFALAEAVGVRLRKEAILEKPLLCTYIRNPFSDFVENVLSQGRDEQTVRHLLDILEDQEQAERFFAFLDENTQTEQVRSMAVRFVRAFNSLQIIEALFSELNEENQTLRGAIVQVLQTFIHFDQQHDEDGARERLLLLTSATEPEVALQATLALGRLGDPRAVDPLLHLLSLYPAEREIIQLLGQLRASSAAETLFRKLTPYEKSTDPFDERIALEIDVIDALEQIEGQRIVERLLPLLDPEPETIMECSFQQGLLAVLARQGSESIVGLLLSLLNPHPKPMYPYDFQLHLLETIANLGEKQAIEPLARLLVLDLKTVSIYEQIFQEYLVKALRQLGDTRAELQAVETALQGRPQRKKLIAKLTAHPQQKNNIY